MTSLVQLQSLFNVTMEIVNRCQPCFRVVQMIVHGGRVHFNYELQSRSELVDKCSALLTWTLEGGIEITLNNGFDWPQLSQLVAMGVPIRSVQEKLEELQVAAGQYEEARQNAAEQHYLFPNICCCEGESIGLPFFAISAHEASSEEATLSFTNPNSALIQGFLKGNTRELFAREPLLCAPGKPQLWT